MHKILPTLWFVLLIQPLFSQPVSSEIPNYQGEEMRYSLKYGRFTIGEARICFKSNEECSGAFIVAEARSSGVVKFFKDIHYRFESCMDTATGLPIQASRVIREDEFMDLNSVDYYHDIREDSSIIYSEGTGSLVVPKNIFDILTGFFHFRKNFIHKNIEQGHVDTITTFFIDLVWDLIITYAGEEVVETDYGDIKCYKFMPQTDVGKYFKTPNDMTLWVTANKRCIPLRIKVKMRYGTLNADIVSYKRPEMD